MTKRLEEIIDILFGMRKFLVMMILIGIAVVFRVKDLVNGDQFVKLLETTVIGFFSVNSVEHLTGAFNKYQDTKGAPQAPQVVYTVPKPDPEPQD